MTKWINLDRAVSYNFDMEYYILDTNIFFNMESGLGLGSTTAEVVGRICEIATRLRSSGEAEFILCPRVVDEISGFFDSPQDPVLTSLLGAVVVKSPDVSKVDFPASVFYKLVDDIRGRSYRGLTIAEEEIEKTARLFMGRESLGQAQFQMTVGPIVKTMRTRYRNATRHGFLDSVADLDLIALARELDGTIVSTDEGVLEWARTFGVKELPPPAFLSRFSA